jgi:hypothetical protein
VRAQRGGWKCGCREGESVEVPGVRAQRGGWKCGCQEGESGEVPAVRRRDWEETMTDWSKHHAHVLWNCRTDIGGESCSSFLGFSGVLWGHGSLFVVAVEEWVVNWWFSFLGHLLRIGFGAVFS